MKKILLSLAIIGIVAGVTLGVTGAWWTDKGVSANQSFHSGTLDLKLSNSSNSGYGNEVTDTWNVSNMVPGGTPYVSTLYMKNKGSINADYLKFSLKTNPNLAGMDKLMRITELSYAGKNLLKGGAGADISDYVAPVYCDFNVNMPGVAGSISTISGAILAAKNGGTTGKTICVGHGVYTSAYEEASSGVISVNYPVTIVSTEGPSKTTSIPFKVTAAGATIKGFTINNPTGSYGIFVDKVGNVSVIDNVITNIGTSASNLYSAQGIYLNGGTTSISGLTFSNNVISNIGHKTMIHGASGQGSSAKGIYIGDTSSGSATISGVVIQNNDISKVYASSLPWGANGGAGAYGVLVNYKGNTSGLTITKNTITNLEALWSHAIGLEGPTPSASVTLNDISDLVSHKIPADEIGVKIEDNLASGIVINKNNFAPNVAFGVVDASLGGGAVNAKNNWWGDFDPSDQVASAGPTITTLPYAGGAFVGFINGKDYNKNGFADLNDFYGVTYSKYDNNPIVVKNPDLSSGGSNYHTLKMGIQLDGPSTGNGFKGGTVGMDMTVVMGQGPAN